MKLGKFNFENKGNSLALGVASYAYIYQDMLAYIDWIKSKKFVILGGDVYSRQGDMFDITYDSWYYTPKNKDNDSQESISVAKNYIKQYTNSNGENFYFAIVVSE